MLRVVRITYVDHTAKTLFHQIDEANNNITLCILHEKPPPVKLCPKAFFTVKLYPEVRVVKV